MTAFPDYDTYDALGLAALVRKGEVSASELLDEAIERVEATNPIINAFTQRFYDMARAAIAAVIQRNAIGMKSKAPITKRPTKVVFFCR